MLSLKSLPARGARKSICAQCQYLKRPFTSRTLSILSHSPRTPSTVCRAQPTTSIFPPVFKNLPIISRPYSTRTPADEIIEEIQDQYATARDEFEIATEETEKQTVYAADDRAAAREALDNLKEMYGKALEGNEGEEVKRRIGQRIRELENAVIALEKSATED